MPPSRAVGESTLSIAGDSPRDSGSFKESSSFLGGVGLTWEGAAAVITTFCLSSSTSLLPFSFGRLGYLGAPLVMVTYIGLAMFVQLKFAEIAASNSSISNVADIGHLLGGRWGRRILAHCCLWNQQFFLPVAVVLTSRTLEFIFMGGQKGKIFSDSCHIWYMLSILVVFVVGTNLTRSFAAAAWLSKLSLVTNTLQVLFILVNLATWKDTTWLTTSPSYAWPPAPSMWNSNATAGELSDRANWGYLFLGVTNIGYAYSPCFITIEIMAEMDDRHEMAKALKFTTSFLIILYLAVGIGTETMLGWRMTYSMAQDLVWDKWGVAANVALCYACIVDYMIAAVTVNKWVQLKINPHFDESDWSLKACLQWFLYTSPSTILSFTMCLLIPRLESLCGILTSVIIPICQLICPACLLLRADRYGLTIAVLQTRERILLICAIAYGVMLLVVGLSSTAYTLSLHFSDSSGDTGGEQYWCDDVG